MHKNGLGYRFVAGLTAVMMGVTPVACQKTDDHEEDVATMSSRLLSPPTVAAPALLAPEVSGALPGGVSPSGPLRTTIGLCVRSPPAGCGVERGRQ